MQLAKRSQSDSERWADAVGHYRRLECHMDTVEAVVELCLCVPEGAPDFVWIAWHEVQVECWSRLAAKNPAFATHDRIIGGYHRKELRRLKPVPAGTGRAGASSGTGLPSRDNQPQREGGRGANHTILR